MQQDSQGERIHRGGGIHRGRGFTGERIHRGRGFTGGEDSRGRGFTGGGGGREDWTEGEEGERIHRGEWRVEDSQGHSLRGKDIHHGGGGEGGGDGDNPDDMIHFLTSLLSYPSASSNRFRVLCKIMSTIFCWEDSTASLSSSCSSLTA